MAVSEEIPFQYVGGDPAIDLVNTVDWTSRGPENDRLTDFGGVIQWAVGAGTLSAKAAQSYRAQAGTRVRDAEAAYRNVVKVRSVLQRLFHAAAEGGPPEDALNDFNRWLGRALEGMRVAPRGGRRETGKLQLGWVGQEENLDSILWPVLWSAASLIVSDEASRIRICGGPDCGWMYVDRSRNKLRRWCQMETCGTREKSRRRYRRMRRLPS
ncbi:MAG TPA: ABATE domain-containing protein [Gemmatimonadales bacterium]|nr:ABATE domain-containing protein [Gemmatimonadales bacterium]